MYEPLMVVEVEVWPLALSTQPGEEGIWLLSGPGRWPSPPIAADSEPHVAAELELIQHQVDLRYLRELHSTSWRTEGTAMICTYLAVIDVEGYVLADWPDACPVTVEVADANGRPPTHGPLDPPTPRYWDVLLHGLRHLRFLLDHDATVAGALGERWARALGPLEPAIAKMYDQVHQSA